ncbi:DNA alkylation repair protein [Eubacterium sp. 1001713B170207_170306_E7]|uniref:DNA alkylation repair protein n=1 Tax=Eubacterium sp. 1001713B170207_170306_E7 TaxID=2787097 RepID=UPI00189863D9|nr:DNA alkylation repair protein [Eubacterium sp. 1001713B170207_170306_E7]
MTIREELFLLAEDDYRKFQQKLLPEHCELIGVRLPALRKIAKRIAKADYSLFLTREPEDYFEEKMLKGMVIGYLNPEKEGLDTILKSIDFFISKIDNWSVCDSFCSGLKYAKTYPDPFWAFVLPKLTSEKAFTLRFGIVMLLFYYIDEAHIHQILELLDSVCHQDYYVKMAVAWALSMCYVKFPDTTLPYLSGENALDTFTYNKALQKIIESRQVSADEKNRIRQMKKRG